MAIQCIAPEKHPREIPSSTLYKAEFSNRSVIYLTLRSSLQAGAQELSGRHT